MTERADRATGSTVRLAAGCDGLPTNAGWTTRERPGGIHANACYRLDVSVRYIERSSMSKKRGGVLELAVLGLLQEAPLHGYELRKRLNTLLGSLRALSYGSLYPALRDMQTA